MRSRSPLRVTSPRRGADLEYRPPGCARRPGASIVPPTAAQPVSHGILSRPLSRSRTPTASLRDRTSSVPGPRASAAPRRPGRGRGGTAPPPTAPGSTGAFPTAGPVRWVVRDRPRPPQPPGGTDDERLAGTRCVPRRGPGAVLPDREHRFGVRSAGHRGEGRKAWQAGDLQRWVRRQGLEPRTR